MQILFKQANDGLPFDEKRLDMLISSMEANPQYLAEKKEEARRWDEEIRPFCAHALQEMRGYVPPHIFTTTKSQLQEELLGFADNNSMNMTSLTPKVAKDLASRLYSKKVLWLLRVPKEEIDKVHEADLLNKYSFQGQGLDIIETAALFAAVPATFNQDSVLKKKEEWRASLMQSLRKMKQKLDEGTLSGPERRHMVYRSFTGTVC